MTANLDGVRVPMGFGVPFYYYEQHMKQNHLDAKVDAMLADPQFKTDPAWRKSALEDAAQGDHRRADRSGRRST